MITAKEAYEKSKENLIDDIKENIASAYLEGRTEICLPYNYWKKINRTPLLEYLMTELKKLGYSAFFYTDANRLHDDDNIKDWPSDSLIIQWSNISKNNE
jgi:hypothetical protein